MFTREAFQGAMSELPCTCKHGPYVTITAGCARHDICMCAECVPGQQPYPKCFLCMTLERLELERRASER